MRPLPGLGRCCERGAPLLGPVNNSTSAFLGTTLKAVGEVLPSPGCTFEPSEKPLSSPTGSGRSGADLGYGPGLGRQRLLGFAGAWAESLL